MFLRVTNDVDGTWDALNWLEDVAKPTEAIFVYRIIAPPTWMHLNRGRGKSGFFWCGRYQLFTPKPTDEEVRANVAWAAWVAATVKRLGLTVDDPFRTG